MAQLCPHCGSKYTNDLGGIVNQKGLAHQYYCESCRRYFEVATGAKSADGEWLMTFYRYYNDYSRKNLVEVYRTPNGKIQINQCYTHPSGYTSCHSAEITPQISVERAPSGNYHLAISTKQSIMDSKGISMWVQEISFNNTLAEKAKNDDAMRGSMRHNTFTCIGFNENKELMYGRQAFLQSLLGTPTKGPCYIATAVYGSYDCPQVWTLRRFRDNTLASTWYGRAFIRTYYAISPALVKWFGHTTWFKNMWRDKLDKMVDALQKQGVESTPYQDKNW